VPEIEEITRTKLVLLVEDQAVDRILFEDSLKSIYDLDTATDSETALARLDSPSQPAVDLLLQDLKVPRRFGQEDSKEEGFKLIEHALRKEGRRSPAIVVLSNYLTPEDRQRLEQLGVRYMLPKRVTDEQLHAAVAGALKPAA
jgi:CheY-like chemotaxis protein